MDGNGASTQQLSAAVEALHGPSAPQREAANAWLAEFVRSDAAWEAGVALLDAGHGAQLQFFGANMVLVKVRSSWASLPAEAQGQLTAAVSGKFQALLAAPQVEAVVVERVCLALAAMAARGGPATLQGFAGQALQLARDSCDAGDLGRLRCGTDLLTAVAEEVQTHLMRPQQQPALEALSAAANDVLSVLGVALNRALDAPEGGERAAVGAIKCFQAWLGVNSSDSFVALVSAGELWHSHRTLFDSLLAALGSHNSQLLEVLGETLVMAFGNSTGKSVSSEVEEAALRAGAQGVLQHRGRVMSQAGEPFCRAAGVAAAAMTETAPEGFAGTFPEAVPLVDMMLECLQRPEQSAADSALQYLTCLDFVPMADRDPALQQPMYARMLPLLLRHAQYPEDFTTWEECLSVDQEAFESFREQALAEGFETAYNVLRMQFLMFCGSALAEAQSWQAAEAALLAIRVAAEDAVPRALEASDDPSEDNADAVATTRYLADLFSALASGTGAASRHGDHPEVAAAAARVVAACSDWFAAERAAPLEAVMTMLLRSLSVPQAARPAARAFRSLCLKCSGHLATPASLAALTPAVSATSQHLRLVDRQALAEGLARLGGRLPAAEAAEAGVNLVTPALQLLQRLLDGSGHQPTEAVLQAASDELMVIATIFQCYESKRGAGGLTSALHRQEPPADEARGQMLRAVYTVLDALLQRPAWRANETAVTAVCEVYGHVMCAVKQSVEGLLPTLVTSLDLAFQATQFAAPLQALADAADVAADAPPAAGALHSAFGSAVSVLGPVFQEGRVSERQDVAAAGLGLVEAVLRAAPQLLLPSPQLPQALGWCCAAAGVREGAPVAAAVSLLHRLVNPQPGGVTSPTHFQAQYPQLRQSISQQGEGITFTVLRALCDTAPRNQMRPLGLLLHSLLAQYGGPAAGWLASSLRSSELQGVMGHQMTEDDCSRFYSIATRTPPLPPMRFSALVIDFANIARGEATGDMLLSYEL
mmetsp:Transcript_17088/g.51068  ORF Transcript_17088/g.51068 Transcript_17088/m.51068 type:complete len:994 (+) Transcript_17088:167-3148(+)